MEKYRLGIDFGTTYSCVAVWKDGGIVIIPNSLNERTTPSVVIFDSPENIFVGEDTLNHLSKKDTVKIYEIKRLIGKRYDQIQDIIKYFPYKIIKEKNGDRPMIKMDFDDGRSVEYYPEQIATLIFKKLISNAVSYLNENVRELLITVPADFTEIQKNAVKYSAEQINDIIVLQLINEPSAAILAYGFPKQYLKNKFFPFNNIFTLVQKPEEHPMEELIKSVRDDSSNNTNENDELIEQDNQTALIGKSLKTSLFNQIKDEMKIIVFDLGGGTYDVSLIYIYQGQIFETMAYEGDQHLGGSDFDNILMDYCLDNFCKNGNYDKALIKKNYKCIQRLKRACEESKKYLSVKYDDKIIINDFYDSKPLSCHITRAKFEDLCKNLFSRLIQPLDSILKSKKLDNKDIDEIVLVGGSSKIPKIKKIIQTKFKDVPLNDNISPDEAVAYGASISPKVQEEMMMNFGKILIILIKQGILLELKLKMVLFR